MIKAQSVNIPVGSAHSLHSLLDHLTVLELVRPSCLVLGALRPALEMTPLDPSARLSEKRSGAGRLGVYVPKSQRARSAGESACNAPFQHSLAAETRALTRPRIFVALRNLTSARLICFLNAGLQGLGFTVPNPGALYMFAGRLV